VPRLLLDTHVLLWALEDSPELGERTRRAITDPRNQVFVSAVSVREIAIKRALGKVQAPDDLLAAVEETGFTELGITLFHAEQAGNLPPHHRDPFDRMLVAQAQAVGLTIVTRDANIPIYGAPTLSA
jgi:PIN domain nuclease of toxin-antitoxin system